MSRSLANAVVVITGASSGIGHATALTFARRGAFVVLVSRSAEALGEVAREIETDGGTALPVAADVARWEDIDRVVSATVARFGGIDVWVNNAAVAEWSLIEQMSPEEMRRVIEVNVLGPMYAVRAALPHLRARGGVIINVASALADRAIPLLSTYSASKAALKSFSDSLRMELRATGAEVDVVTILPSSINTPFYRWGPSKLGVRPHPVSVIYPPQIVAEAIAGAAERPQREIFVGMMGKLLSIGERVSPRMLDWYMLRRQHFFREQLSSDADRGESNLFASAGETDIEGPFSGESRRTSVYTKVVAMRPNLRRAAVAAGLALGAAALFRRVSRRSRAGRE
jgi:short-subunit dehydrogenase